MPGSFFFFLMLHKIGIIIIPADVETETKATNTWRMETWMSVSQPLCYN